MGDAWRTEGTDITRFMNARGGSISARAAFALVALACAACRDSTAAPSVTGIVLRAPFDSVFFGKTLRVQSVATGDSTAVAWPKFAWSSSDTSVAVVDSLGVALALRVGSATIRAELAGKSDSLRIRVVLFDPLPALRFTVISTGFDGVCAVSTTAGVFCGESNPIDSMPRFTLLPGSEQISFVSFHATIHSACGLSADSLMYCWGQNAHYHFGNGTSTAFRTTTAPALGGHGRRFLALTVGGHSQTCGVNAADSVVYCFGHNDFGQVGHGTVSGDDSLVAPVAGALRGRAVSANSANSCALDLSGAPYCWGAGGGGITSGPGTSGTPQRISTSVAFASIHVGHTHACALDRAGAAYCWGANVGGALTDTASQVTHTVPEQIGGDLRFSFLSATLDATCGVTAAGALYCWGEFSPDSLRARSAPTGPLPMRLPIGVPIRSVGSSYPFGSHHYWCAITTAGKLLCW
jgi:hypothetical protein